MKKITLGILGGGQLGRMSAMAAARLGTDVHIFTPEHNSPASQVCARTIQADYDDKAALANFAADVDFITYEFENIPVDTVRYLETLKPVYPKPSLLEVSQDRIAEKSFLNSIGIETTRWEAIASPQDIENCIKNWNAASIIIKTARFGYDGKGQIKFKNGDNPDDVFHNLKGQLIAEEIVDFDSEISMIIARDQFGDISTYGPMLNEHRNHILHKTTYPSGLGTDLCCQSIHTIKNLAKSIDLIGVLTLEMFVTRDGRLLANEIAPRTHNSGHWTIDACAASQFEQHIRTVCGLPVTPSTNHSEASMINLIGEDVLNIDQYLNAPDTCLHLYGKTEPHPGRKMGHVTFIGIR
jgi:5-(carboxyamino)imidazole ribonucleotide synthase